jgi:hypothetical protein
MIGRADPFRGTATGGRDIDRGRDDATDVIDDQVHWEEGYGS